MPVSMAQKREMKAQLQNATKLRLQGLDQIKWQRRKVFKQFQAKWSEYLSKMELWRNSMKAIEGNCGTGVVAYFLFLRWLIMLNLSIFVIILLFILLPQTMFTEPEAKVRCDDVAADNGTDCCFARYIGKNSTSALIVLDLIQGTGFMEKTAMFYGMYSNRIFESAACESTEPPPPAPAVNDNETRLVEAESMSFFSTILDADTYHFYYDLPLAYLSVNVVFLLLSLMAIMKSVSREFKDRMVEGEGQFYQYCNLVFGGWDFCIHNEKSAHIKHKALWNEIKGLLHSKRIEYERHNRSKDVMFKLVAIRFMVNVVVCIILMAAAILIYFTFNQSLNRYLMDRIETLKSSSTGEIEILTIYDNLKYEFMPYITIVCINFLVPLIFNYLVQFEQYSPMFVIKITLLRTVFLRLSSLAVLLSRFYFLIEKTQMPSETSDGMTSCKDHTLLCWETFVGQQFYKLLVVDFVTHLLVTFFVNFPRALIARHINTKFTRFIGEQEFELSKHVLDIVYSQTLCWLGTFYSPFVPAISVVLHFFMFYVKKFACLINSKPSAILYRTSRSNSLFMSVLLLSYVLAVVPIVYTAAEMRPSPSCGPFRGLHSVWHAAIDAFMKLPEFFQEIIFFLGTAGFAVPCFVVLILFLYYYYAVSAANKHMVEVLKNQLVLEGHDKQFLLNRLSAFLKQQQDFYKQARQTEQQHSQQLPPPPPPARGVGSGAPPPVAPHSKEFIKEKELRERNASNDIRDN